MKQASLVKQYLQQLKDLSLPDIRVDRAGNLPALLDSISPPSRNSNGKKPAPEGKSGTVPLRHSPVSVQGKPDLSHTLKGRLKPVGSAPSSPVRPRQDTGAFPSSAESGREEKRRIFIELYSRRCDRCPLAASRKRSVFGAGNVDAPLLIIGEAPGAQEDEQGLPFVGAAGRLLTELLSAVSLDRKKDVFITNVLKCRPPENRDPADNEIAACLPLLHKQIEVIHPRALLLLGRVAARAVLDTAEDIGALRDRDLRHGGIPVVVTYHPAEVLRSPEKYREPAQADLRRAALLCTEGNNHGPV